MGKASTKMALAMWKMDLSKIRVPGLYDTVLINMATHRKSVTKLARIGKAANIDTLRCKIMVSATVRTTGNTQPNMERSAVARWAAPGATMCMTHYLMTLSLPLQAISAQRQSTRTTG